MFSKEKKPTSVSFFLLLLGIVHGQTIEYPKMGTIPQYAFMGIVQTLTDNTLTYNNCFSSLELNVSCPECNESILATCDKRAILSVPDLKHWFSVWHVLNLSWKVECNLEYTSKQGYMITFVSKVILNHYLMK